MISKWIPYVSVREAQDEIKPKINIRNLHSSVSIRDIKWWKVNEDLETTDLRNSNIHDNLMPNRYTYNNSEEVSKDHIKEVPSAFLTARNSLNSKSNFWTMSFNTQRYKNLLHKSKKVDYALFRANDPSKINNRFVNTNQLGNK